MKKLFLIAGIVALMALVAGPVIAQSYHNVYKWEDEIGEWLLEAYDGVGKTVVTQPPRCEMFSKESESHQYRWESAEGISCCSPEYGNPTPEPPPQFHLKNFAHLFPWIEVYFDETVNIWDIFKPGVYAGRILYFTLQANCPVQVHFGGGEWMVPGYFDPEDVHGQNGHIEMVPMTKEAEEEVAGPKQRLYSMLGKDDISGTPPDEIDWWLYWEQVDEVVHCEPVDLPAFGSAPWIPSTALNGQSMIIEDSEELHVLKTFALYEAIEVEECDSEGKYYEEFAVTITPDP